MSFNWLLLFLLLPPLLFVVLADNNSQRQRQFNCPNGGEPKADERTGKPLQCLPGRRSSSAICGLHHSCFFSGFNYQCCPSLSEDEDENNFVNQQSIETEHRQQPTADDDMAAENECPAGSFSVFGPEGALLRCGRLRSQTECSKPSMFCHVGVSMQICCERFESDGPLHQSPHQTQVSGEVIVPTSSREAVWHSTDGQSRGEADAVGHSIDRGEADAVGHSIDRGEADAVGHSIDKGEADAVGHSIDRGEADAVGHSTDGGEANDEKSKRQPQFQPPPHGTSSNRSTSPMPTLDMKDGESSAESVRPSLSSAERPPPFKPKNIIQQAAKTAQRIGQDEDEHGTGSKEQKSNTNNFNKFNNNNNNNKEEEYAPTKLLKEFSNVADEPAQQHRTASQQYILEKISDGWPYDDKFYRPTNNNNNEDIFVMRKRGRPSAIVYLPN
uniref:Uncharacterized protein n=1 Tax=Globodera rostochiensis TaxID=31243 RepID=A0A914HT26_GLORO